MFTRPDWKDPCPYEGLIEPGCARMIAWEFLRRNPNYQRDWEAFQSEVIEWCNNNPRTYQDHRSEMAGMPDCFVAMAGCFEECCDERHTTWERYAQNKWRLGRMWGPDYSWGGDEVLIAELYDKPELFEPVRLMGPPVKGPYVSIPVDLSRSLESIHDHLMWTVKRLRDEGIKTGTVTPQKHRILSHRIYVEHLRILDGIAAGATVQKIGQVLTPAATNNPNENQRDKRTRAAHAAAVKMQDGGYRKLL